MVDWIAVVVKAPWTAISKLLAGLSAPIKRAMQRPSIDMVVGQLNVSAPAGGDDSTDVSAIAIRVGLTNSSATHGSVAMLRLQIEGFPAFFPEDADVIDSPERRKEAMARRRVLFARVSPGAKWLRLPVNLPGWGSETGWVGFRTTGAPNQRLTIGDLKKRGGRLVATVGGGREISQPLGAVDLWA